MPRGGKRPGAGRKPGARNKLTVAEKRTLAEIAGDLTADAIAVLAKVMRDPKAPAAARVTAANSILDRGHGKPKQPVEHELDLDNLTNEQLAALAIALGAPSAAVDGLVEGSAAQVTH